MKSLKFGSLFLFFLMFWGLISLSSAWSETAQKGAEKAPAKPLVINSKALEVDNKLKVVIFTGDVDAKVDEFSISCQKMLVSYENSPTQKNTGDIATRIDKIVATGDVRIVRAQGGIATSEKAEYYQQDEKIVLTGRPVVKSGDDFVQGDRITIFLRENRSVVESSSDNKVRAIIFPKREIR